MSLKLSGDVQRRVQETLARYPHKRAALLPVLHIVQEEIGYIPEEAEGDIAAIVAVPVVKLREVLSFYTLFRRRPIGTYHLQVCRTVSCVLCGQRSIMHYIEQKLGIREGETTPDGRFTLTTVECLAACETAPMMQVNDKYYGNLSPEKVDEILANLNGKKK